MQKKDTARDRAEKPAASYSPPRLVIHGAFSELTAAGSGLRIEGGSGNGGRGNPNRRP